MELYDGLCGEHNPDAEETDNTLDKQQVGRQYDQTIEIGHKVRMGRTSRKAVPDERQKSLLDAAERLVLRQGFDKTTVADLASAAGVSKGAVYLHFVSKDELLEAVVVRAMVSYSRAWVEAVEADPNGGRIGGMYRCALRALTAHPILAALMRRDAEVFGSFLRRPGSALNAGRSTGSRKEFIEAMQQAGAIRKEIDPAVMAYILNMISFSLVSMPQIVEPATVPPIDAVLEVIAGLLDRALTPESGAHPEAGKAIVRKIYEAGAARWAQRQGERH